MSGQHPKASGSLPHGIAARYVLVALVFLCRVVQTFMRMALGAVIVYMCEDLTCTQVQKGWLLSSYSIGYCTTQVLGGQVADRLGGKAVITWAMVLAGIALAVTPFFSAAFGLAGVVISQVAMGVATGPLFPASIQLLAKWLPSDERAWASTALDTGITAGALIAVHLSGALATSFGWQSPLVLYGFCSLGFAALWSGLAAEDPARCRYCSDEERTLLLAAAPAAATGPKAQVVEPVATGFKAMLLGIRYKQLWAIYLSHFAFNFGLGLINSWSGIYYLEVFGLRPEQAKWHLIAPHITNLFVVVVVGPALDRLLRSLGFSTLGCRRVFSGIGFLIPALLFRLVPLCSFYLTTLCFSMILGAFALHPCGFKANYMDVTRNHGGLVSGIGNTIASMGSSAAPPVVAYLRERSGGSWEPAFSANAVACLLAAILFCTTSSATPIEVHEAASRHEKTS